jgi:hypothetical protein
VGVGTIYDQMVVQDYIDKKLVHSLHTSESKSFRGCRRRWNWIFREFWYPRTTAKPLEFGTAYHTGMEAFYRPEMWDKPRAVVTELAIQAFRKKCSEQYEAYLEAFPNPDESVKKDYDERMALGEGMIRYHANEVSPVLDRDFIPRKVEIAFEIPVTNPENGDQLWCRCDTCWSRWLAYDALQHEQPPKSAEIFWAGLRAQWRGLPVTYGGRIDAIFEGVDGRYWVVDWKTAAQLAGDRDEFLLIDDQITRYCYALKSIGINIAGFIYHEQKKGFPEEPEPMTRRRLGCLYSVSKAQNTNYELYKRTVEENDPSGYLSGAYDEFLDWLKDNGGVFHERHIVHRNDKELRASAWHIWDEACDMTDRNLRIYPNAGRFSCGSCAFRQPCIGANNGEDYAYTLSTMFDKRKYHYWEDKVPSTETKGNE